MSRLTSLEHTFVLPVEPAAAFEMFSDPHRLDSLTPPWFRMRPRGPLPRQLKAGERISYSLTWRGLPLSWTSLLTEWQEPTYLVYEQHRGPYRYFRHEHAFTAVAEGTEIRDRAIFSSPAGALVDRWVVRRDLRRIFTYREVAASAQLAELARPEISISRPVLSTSKRPSTSTETPL